MMATYRTYVKPRGGAGLRHATALAGPLLRCYTATILPQPAPPGVSRPLESLPVKLSILHTAPLEQVPFLRAPLRERSATSPSPPPAVASPAAPAPAPVPVRRRPRPRPLPQPRRPARARRRARMVRTAPNASRARGEGTAGLQQAISVLRAQTEQQARQLEEKDRQILELHALLREAMRRPALALTAPNHHEEAPRRRPWWRRLLRA